MVTNKFTHIDHHNQPSMVDVSDKKITSRQATAQSIVLLPDNIKALLTDGEIQSKKGPVFQTAIIAGVMAAKKTHELIPFCHPLGIENCKVNINVTESKDLLIICDCKVTGKTGVEMEALTGASVAALTIYDMCKAISHSIIITETKLLQKSGGKSDFSTP
jgi:cyclic pyranopterin phosphate synthase